MQKDPLEKFPKAHQCKYCGRWLGGVQYNDTTLGIFTRYHQINFDKKMVCWYEANATHSPYFCKIKHNTK